MRCWCSYLSAEMCRLFAYGPADATASQTPSYLALFKSRLVLPFWYWLTQVGLGKPWRGRETGVVLCMGGMVAKWLVCWTQVQKGLGLNQSGNSLRQIVHTHCASIHQAAKLVEALLRVAGVTAGLAESKDSLLPGLWITCRLTAKNYDQHRNPTLSNQVWATFF